MRAQQLLLCGLQFKKASSRGDLTLGDNRWQIPLHRGFLWACLYGSSCLRRRDLILDTSSVGDNGLTI